MVKNGGIGPVSWGKEEKDRNRRYGSWANAGGMVPTTPSSILTERELTRP